MVDNNMPVQLELELYQVNEHKSVAPWLMQKHHPLFANSLYLHGWYTPACHFPRLCWVCKCIVSEASCPSQDFSSQCKAKM